MKWPAAIKRFLSNLTNGMKQMNISYEAYQAFAEKVANEYRFVLDDKSTALQTMLKETAEKRAVIIGSDQHLYRARKGYEKIESACFLPYSIDSMLAPPPNKAREGRVNPKGIPCFYAANLFDTAVRELRPWIGELISVAIFRPSRDLKVVDLTKDGENSITFKRCLNIALPESDEEIENQIWSELNNAFSEPISIDAQTEKYAPTQIISEWFKSWGYDGVVYKSSVHPEGKNYAFFDPSYFTTYNEGGRSQVVRVTKLEVAHDTANTILSVSENKTKAE